MNQTPRRAQEDKASIPFQSQYKNSMIHGNFLTLERRKNGKKNKNGGEDKGRRELVEQRSWLPSSLF